MTVKLEIPVIDLARSAGAEREKLCKEIARACEEWGFFQVINHGVDESLMKRAQDVYTEFFHSPVEEKMKILIPEDSIQGWKHPTLTKSSDFLKNISGADTAEYVNNVWLPGLPQHREKWPTTPSTLQPTIIEFVNAAKCLHEELLRMMAEGLGLESDAFVKPFLTPQVSVRSNFYPLRTDGTSVGHVHPHSDVSGTTLLLSDMAVGLEVKKDESWVQVQPQPSGFVVNVGDLVEIYMWLNETVVRGENIRITMKFRLAVEFHLRSFMWTVCQLCGRRAIYQLFGILSNGKLKSVLHRGFPHPSKERLSIACFYMANNDAVLSPLEELLNEDHRAKYRAIRFEEYFESFLGKGNKFKGRIDHLKIEY